MRAVVITRHGGPDTLQVQERPDPPAVGPGEVRIEVAAAGVNFADVMARIGVYPDAPPTPCVVGYEVAGTVLEVGEGVERAPAVGERVFGATKFGGYASQVVLGAEGIDVEGEGGGGQKKAGEGQRHQSAVHAAKLTPARRTSASAAHQRRCFSGVCKASATLRGRRPPITCAVHRASAAQVTVQSVPEWP